MQRGGKDVDETTIRKILRDVDGSMVGGGRRRIRTKSKRKKKMPSEHPERAESDGVRATVFDVKEMLTILLDYVGPAAA